MRRYSRFAIATFALAAACGRSPGSTSQPPSSPAPGPPDPSQVPTTAQPSPPGPAPTPEGGTIRWSDLAPGIFWVGMDDSGARWAASAVRASDTSPDDGVLRLQKRDRDGHVLWTGDWPYTGTYRFSAAVSPEGEAFFSATPACLPDDPSCHPSIALLGVTHANVAVKLRSDGSVRWVRDVEGYVVERILGADLGGGSAIIQSAAGSHSAYVVKLDADGNEVWSKEITSIASFVLDRTGDVLATGCYQGDTFLLPGIPCQNGMVAARLGRDGATLWTAHVDGYWAQIGSAADGSGVAASRGGAPYDLTSLSPDGAVRWSRSFGSGLFANQRGDPLLVAVAADGPVAIAGYTYLPPGDTGVNPYAVVTGFDAAGAPTFVLELTTLPTPVSAAYGRDRELVLAVGPGTLVKAGGQTESIPAMIVDLVP